MRLYWVLRKRNRTGKRCVSSDVWGEIYFLPVQCAERLDFFERRSLIEIHIVAGVQGTFIAALGAKDKRLGAWKDWLSKNTPADQSAGNPWSAPKCYRCKLKPHFLLALNMSLNRLFSVFLVCSVVGQMCPLLFRWAWWWSDVSGGGSTYQGFFLCSMWSCCVTLFNWFLAARSLVIPATLTILWRQIEKLVGCIIHGLLYLSVYIGVHVSSRCTSHDFGNIIFRRFFLINCHDSTFFSYGYSAGLQRKFIHSAPLVNITACLSGTGRNSREDSVTRKHAVRNSVIENWITAWAR